MFSDKVNKYRTCEKATVLTVMVNNYTNIDQDVYLRRHTDRFYIHYIHFSKTLKVALKIIK